MAYDVTLKQIKDGVPIELGHLKLREIPQVGHELCIGKQVWEIEQVSHQLGGPLVDIAVEDAYRYAQTLTLYVKSKGQRAAIDVKTTMTTSL